MSNNYKSNFNEDMPNMNFNFKNKKVWFLVGLIVVIVAVCIIFIKEDNTNKNTSAIGDNNQNEMNSSSEAKNSNMGKINGKNIVNDNIYYVQIQYGEIDSTTGVSKVDYKTYKIKTDGSDKKLISEKEMYKIQYSNGYLYGIVDNNICRMKEDGTEFKNITTGLMVDWFTVYEDYIYYAKEDSNGSDDLFDKVARINVDGTNDKILDERSARFCIADKDGVFLVYPDGKSGSKIEKVDYDGKSIKIFEAGAGNVMKDGDNLYYTNINDNYSLYKIKMDGTENKKISNERLLFDGASTILSQSNGRLFYGVIGDYIYYINVEDGEKPYRIKIDGSDKKKMSDDRLKLLQIKGENIYIQRIMDQNLKVTDKDFTSILDVTKDSVDSLWID